MKKDPIILMLRKPCNTCTKGPYAMRDKTCTFSGVGPMNGKCSNWAETMVLIVYDEEPE